MDEEHRRFAEIQADIAARVQQASHENQSPRPLSAGSSGEGCAAMIVAVVAIAGVALFFGSRPHDTSGSHNAGRPEAAPNASFPTMAVHEEDWAYDTEPGAPGAAAIRTACIQSSDAAGPDVPYQQPHATLCIRSGGRSGANQIRLDDQGRLACARDCGITVKFDDGFAESVDAAVPADGSTGMLVIEGADRFIAGARQARSITLEATRSETRRPALIFRATSPLTWN